MFSLSLAQGDPAHLFSCPSTAPHCKFLGHAFVKSRIRSCLKSPTTLAHSDVLLSVGRSLASFRAVLHSALSDAISQIPLTISPRSTCLAVLCVLHLVAYTGVWKPRCTLFLAAEQEAGITASMKRTRPADRPNPPAPIIPGAADVIPQSVRNHSPALSRTLE